MKHRKNPLDWNIPQQYMVGDIKVNTQAQIRRTYTRLLIDAFVPYEEAMLAYLDALIATHDPKLVQDQLDEAREQDNKTSRAEEPLVAQFGQADAAEQITVLGNLRDIWDGKNALFQTTMTLGQKLDIATRSYSVLQKKREAIVQLLRIRQDMLAEGTWEKIGDKEKMSMVFSLLGDDELSFDFSAKRLKASAINDIYDWMQQYHPESLPPGEPFYTSSATKKAPIPEKKEVPPTPPTEYPNIPDDITASIRTFLAIRRPGYTLTSLVDRTQDDKPAWVAHLSRTLHDETVEHVSDVIIALEPHKYMTIQNVQDTQTL